LSSLYGENHNSNSTVALKDVVVSAILSDFKLGPKLYGFFPLGRIEQFIEVFNSLYIFLSINSLFIILNHFKKAPCLDQNDMYIPKVSSAIAHALAKFHTLEMPFSKEPRWLFETTAK
jgi:choline/ethanolamine kinase